MQNTAPEVGKTYQSTTEPSFFLHVQEVHHLNEEENEGHPATFCVEACEPQDIGDFSAIGYDLIAEEWNEHGFIPVSAPEPTKK